MNEIVAITNLNPVACLTDGKAYSEFYKSIKAQLADFIPDVSTERGRKEIASMAYKVTRSKTAIDDAGKKLNEDARTKINAVDAQRRKIREELDALAEDVRRPLTEWETEEEARTRDIEDALSTMLALEAIPHGAGSAEIRRRWEELSASEVDPDVFRDRQTEAVTLRQRVLDVLASALDKAVQHEADQAELARLRAEQERQERLEREAREAEARQRAEDERREREASEIRAREERAAEQARLAAEKAAKAEQDRVERVAAERVAKAEAEARAIREKVEREARERDAATETLAASAEYAGDPDPYVKPREVDAELDVFS